MRRCFALTLALFASLALAQDAELSGEITVWSWDIAAESLEALVPGFNEMHPNVTVTVLDLGNDPVFDRGLAGCAAGGVDLPDVYSVENNEAEIFWSRFPDCFADLSAFGAEDLREDFPEFKWLELTMHGNIYAVPWDSGPVVIFYRRDLYEDAGVDSEEIETWDDFIAAGEQVLSASDGQVRMGTIARGEDDEWFRMLANQAGCFYFDETGEQVTVNQPGCVQALETIGELVDAGLLAFGGWVEQIQLIQASRVASAMFGAWYEGTIRGNAPDQEGLWGVYRMPALEEGGTRAANIGGSALAIPASSQNQEAAWAFVEYALATSEGQVTMLQEYGLVPSYLPALDDPYVSEAQPYWGDQAIWQLVLETLDEIEPARGTQFFQEARDIMTTIQSQYLDGRFASAQEALDAAAQQISNATGLPVAGGAAAR
jgi:lactose/L-arabinose transport system substrate-binding protein